jgi:hypothetical protein
MFLHKLCYLILQGSGNLRFKGQYSEKSQKVYIEIFVFDSFLNLTVEFLFIQNTLKKLKYGENRREI